MTHKVLANKINSLQNNRGQALAEYILIIGLIALAAIASFTPLGKILSDKFIEFAAKISS